MSAVILHPLADEEMTAQAAYYERHAKGLGREFLNEVERASNASWHIRKLAGQRHHFAGYSCTGFHTA